MARFSEMLLNRRRQLGMSIQQVANVIKIRPQIIEYFENGEFTQMPPRGYAQGMISSYARYLGLNPREVIDAYFDDLYEFEKSARTQAGRFQDAVMESTPRSAAGSRVAPSRLAGARGSARPPQAGYLTDYEAVHGSDVTRSLPRNAYSPAPADRRRSQAGSMRRTGVSASPRGASARRGSAPSSRRGSAESQAQRREAPYGRRASAPSRSGRRGQPQGITLDPRLLMIGGALVVVLLIVLVVLVVRGCTAQPASTDSSGTAAATQTAGTDAAGGADPSADESDAGAAADTGSTDQEGGDNSSADAAGDETGSQDASSDAVPEQTVMTVSVDDGSSVWMEITVDGTAVYAAQTEGPFEQEYTPSETFEIRVDKSEAVTVLQNGEEISFDRKSAGVSRITVEVPQASADTADAGAAADDVTDGSADGTTQE